jgi:hypothetical protein
MMVGFGGLQDGVVVLDRNALLVDDAFRGGSRLVGQNLPHIVGWLVTISWEMVPWLV